MAKVQSYDPNKLEFRSGGGCLSLFGLFFFLPGLAVIAGGFVGGSDGPPIFFALPFGGIFCLVGGAFLFGRSGMTFDKRSGKLETWWGAFFYKSRTEYSLSDIKMVALSRETRGSGKNRRTVYPVRIEGNFPTPVELEAPLNPTEGRSLAEDVAKFLDLGMRDVSSGTEIIREAGTLDFSIRQRFEADGYEPELMDRPAGAKSTHTPMGSTHKINIPPRGFTCGSYAQIGVGLVFSGMFSLGFFPVMFDKDIPTAVRIPVLLVMGLFISIPFMALVGSAISGAKASYEVEVTPMKFVLVTKGMIKDSREEIPANELEELEIAGRVPGKNQLALILSGQSIMVRSDTKTISFGYGLLADELDWIVSIIEVGLCS